MHINILTLFPEYFDGVLSASLLGRAVASGIVDVTVHSLREHGLGKHRRVDDAPYGGGQGMVMMVEPIDAALAQVHQTTKSHVILLSPRGRTFDQAKARELHELAKAKAITLVCGHYEGIDERVADNLADESISVGDFVLSGGEPAAAIILDAIARQQPGFMSNPDSLEDESFREEGYVEYPQYTRPSDYKGWRVPEVLLSGDHAAIAKWRQDNAKKNSHDRKM